MEQPTLRTPRLVLRPFQLADAAVVQRLAGDPSVADTTMNIPHPYLDGLAESWIASHAAGWEDRSSVTFAVVGPDGALRGAVRLQIADKHKRGELGYWIGVPYWGQGLATEAVLGVLAWAFEQLELNRVQATHLARNPASGRVMQKAGMTCEGLHRESFRKNGRFEDIAEYAILRRDWKAAGG